MHVENWPLARPRPYERNPRVNAGAAVAKVAASLREYGWKQPIVVDADGVIIVGHTRLLAAQSLGLAEVPVVVARDLTPAQVKAYRLADNRTNEEAEWDTKKLALELSDLQLDSFDLALTGFDADELEGFAALLEATPEGLTADDHVPALDPAVTSVAGDLWLLGPHRLLVGDSTSVDAVARLMAGEKADLIVTDPPYNVAYEGGSRAVAEGKTRKGIKNDKMSDEKFHRFLSDVYTNLFTVAGDGACIYVFHGESEGVNFRTAMTASGFKLSQCCIWVKNSFVISRQDYHGHHEPCLFGYKDGEAPAEQSAYEPDHETALYGWKPTAAHRWYADRKQSTVWHFDRPQKSAEHPTMKPVALIEYPITNSSQPGDLVLDLFGGSGSTLIACEKIARRARLMELDPKYADVIVRRWQEFTGKTARHEDGTPFDTRAA
jgi:DNA modification methylase